MDLESHIQFKFKSETQLGQSIHLVGNHPSLGEWNPQKSIKLSTDPFSYPFWTTPIVSLPLNTSIEYKYLFKTQDLFTWELLPNRKLTLSQKKVVIEDTDQSSTSKIFYTKADFLKTETFFDEKMTLTSKDSLLIVTTTLPVAVSKDSQGNWDFQVGKGIWQSQLYNILNFQKSSFLWFGLIDYIPINEDEQESLQNIMKSQYKCVPVFMEAQILEEHDKFCSMVLYKLLHNIIDLSLEALQCNAKLWSSYKLFNILFSEAILTHYSRQMIWVHGPQFFLLPSYMSRKTKEIMNIGFFLHHPFPSSEIYRLFPYREAILHALCCCDMIGFHLFEYSRNFLGCCKRVLGLSIEPTSGGYFGLNYYGRHIMVRSEHIGIQPDLIENIIQSTEFTIIFKSLTKKYKGQRVLLSIDAAHELAGLPMKLKAFHLAYKKFNENIVLVQILIPQQTLAESLKIKEQVFSIAQEINEAAGKCILEVIEKNISVEERYAYMKISQGLIINCIKDGLCLQPFEYLVIKKESNCRIVLSEFAGVSTALNSPKKVNPFNIEEVENAIVECVENGDSEQQINKVKRDLRYIYLHDTFNWIQNFLSDLKKAHKDTESLHYLIHGLGDKLKLIALKKNFKKMNKHALITAYSQAKNRVLFFDNEGTLSNFMKQKEINKKIGPSARILKALGKLCEDKRNTVYVITGRPQEVVYNWFKSVDNLGLAAEYGAKMRSPGSIVWETYYSTKSDWKETAKEIMSGYSERTEGSQIVEKESSVVFLYRESEVELGSYQAKELVSHLDFLLQPYMDEMEICEGIGYVEVKPIGINKGTALYRVIESLFDNKGPVDFILAIGDDSSDESMFKMVRMLKKQKSRTLLNSKIPTFTCTLGIKPSSASYFLLDATKVVSLLEHINGEGQKEKRIHSCDDIFKASKVVSTSQLKSRLNGLNNLDKLEDDYED